jgi:hypothetical protein
MIFPPFTDIPRPLDSHCIAQVKDTRDGSIQRYFLYSGKTEQLGYSLNLMILFQSIFIMIKLALLVAGEPPPVLFAQMARDMSLGSMLKS